MELDQLSQFLTHRFGILGEDHGEIVDMGLAGLREHAERRVKRIGELGKGIQSLILGKGYLVHGLGHLALEVAPGFAYCLDEANVHFVIIDLFLVQSFDQLFKCLEPTANI
jgi:hypothetical protein